MTIFAVINDSYYPIVIESKMNLQMAIKDYGEQIGKILFLKKINESPTASDPESFGFDLGCSSKKAIVAMLFG